MMRSSRERYPPMERSYPLPPMSSMRGDYISSREMFSRRTPPPRGRSSYAMYEDFSRDSFDDRRGGAIRGDRYAPY